MLAKNSIIFLVVAFLAQVSSVVSATESSSATGNSTWTPNFERMLDRPTPDRPCLNSVILEQMFDALLELKDEDGCRECKNGTVALKPSDVDIPNCSDFVKPYCEAVQKCQGVCGEMTWYIVHEIFRCSALKTISKVYGRVQHEQKRLFRLQMVPDQFISKETRAKLDDLKWFIDVDPMCPVDCHGFLADGEDIVGLRDHDKSMLDVIGTHLEHNGIFSNNDDQGQNEGSERHNSLPFSDGPCLNELQMTWKFAKCVHSENHSEESLLQAASCLACGIELSDYLDQSEKGMPCSKRLAPFCEPSSACIKCGTCRQHLNSMILCAQGDQGCPMTCDEISSE